MKKLVLKEDGFYEITNTSNKIKFTVYHKNNITYYPCPSNYAFLCKNAFVCGDMDIPSKNYDKFCMDEKFTKIMEDEKFVDMCGKLSNKKSNELLDKKMKEMKVDCYGDGNR